MQVLKSHCCKLCMACMIKLKAIFAVFCGSTLLQGRLSKALISYPYERSPTGRHSFCEILNSLRVRLVVFLQPSVNPNPIYMSNSFTQRTASLVPMGLYVFFFMSMRQM